MLKFLVIRHGETVSNAENRFSGHQNVDLTEKGIWQAEQLADRLKNEQIDFAYSSDLKRAVETARIALQHHNIDVKVEPLLKEINFGDWEDLRFKDLDFEEGERLMEWWKYPEMPFPGGESTAELRKRVLSGLEKIIKEHYEEKQQKIIAIVCHGGVSRAIISIALDIPVNKIWHIRQSSTAVNVLNYYKNSGYYVELINDTNHLKTETKKEKIVEK